MGWHRIRALSSVLWEELVAVATLLAWTGLGAWQLGPQSSGLLSWHSEACRERAVSPEPGVEAGCLFMYLCLEPHAQRAFFFSLEKGE